jgi:hypothetical protein
MILEDIPKAAGYVQPALAIKDMFRSTAKAVYRFRFVVCLNQNITPLSPFVPLCTTKDTFYRNLGSSVKEKLLPGGCLCDIFWAL